MIVIRWISWVRRTKPSVVEPDSPYRALNLEVMRLDGKSFTYVFDEGGVRVMNYSHGKDGMSNRLIEKMIVVLHSEDVFTVLVRSSQNWITRMCFRPWWQYLKSTPPSMSENMEVGTFFGRSSRDRPADLARTPAQEDLATRMGMVESVVDSATEFCQHLTALGYPVEAVSWSDLLTTTKDDG